MAANISQYDVDIQEQFARIRKYNAESDRLFEERRKYLAEIEKIADERLKIQQERQLAPWQLVIGGVTAGAALFAAAVAFVKYLL